jgi:hypothetical protein
MLGSVQKPPNEASNAAGYDNDHAIGCPFVKRPGIEINEICSSLSFSIHCIETAQRVAGIPSAYWNSDEL